MKCLDLDQLESFAEGTLGRADTASAEGHLTTCVACAGRLDEVRENLKIVGPLGGAFGLSAVEAPPSPAPVPKCIGPFRIIREIGRGGMGTVYEARQDRPARTVALKVIKPDQTTPTALRRFEHEAQILGRLQHPGIAQIFEAAATDSSDGSRPYFAMELVHGQSLRDYVRQATASPRRVLTIIASVCDAIHHAHQNGVIHRDLKPSNIVVDKSGQPKILDFGVARLTDSDVQVTTVHTDVRQLIGTLPYMSPEQVSGDLRAVDSRSDVYAVGVVTYELLANRLPYELTHRSITDAARSIQEDDPIPLSSIDRIFRGDIETIVAKALEKDKNRRYQSAADLAADIRHYLGDEPIVARPQSSMYLLRKFVRRNRALVGGAVAVLIVLIAGATVSAWQAYRATAHAARANREAARALAVSGFLQDMLASADPAEIGGSREISVREVLDRAATKLDNEDLRGQPEIEAVIRTTIGNAYRSLGLYDAAEPQLRRAVDIGSDLAPAGSEDLAQSLNKLGRLMQERGRLDDAEVYFQRALRIRRDLLGEDHPDVATILNNLAWLKTEQGDYDAALVQHERALEIRLATLGDVHVDVASSLNNLAVVYYKQGDFRSAEPLLRRSLAMDRELRGVHPNVATTMTTLGLVLKELGKTDEAERLMRDSLRMRRDLVGEDHPDTATGINNLAVLLKETKRFDEAEALFRRSLAIGRRLFGDAHIRNVTTLNNLGALLSARGRPREAEALHTEALEVVRAEYGDTHPTALITRFHLASVRLEDGKPAEAESLIRATVADARQSLPEDHWNTGIFLRCHGRSLMALGRMEAAESALHEAYRILSKQVGDRHPATLSTIELLADLYIATDKPELADQWRRQSMATGPGTEADPARADRARD